MRSGSQPISFRPRLPQLGNQAENCGGVGGGDKGGVVFIKT